MLVGTNQKKKITTYGSFHDYNDVKYPILVETTENL